MKQPDGYKDRTGHICYLKKTLYGLKQARHKWNKEFNRQICTKGFHQLKSDPCAYIQRKKEDLFIINIWVDDLLSFANLDEMKVHTKKDLESMFELIDMGEPSTIVGIKISQGKDSITISQTKYVESILRKAGMEQANTVCTPLDPKLPIKPNLEGNEGDKRNSFTCLLSSLQYLTTATCPDITFAVNRLSTYTANPSLAHQMAVKHILRYLAGTKDLGITYRKPQQSQSHLELLHRFSDTAYANNSNYCSTSGYVFIVGGGAVMWGSRKQTSVALSSIKVKYVALPKLHDNLNGFKHYMKNLDLNKNTPYLYLEITEAHLQWQTIHNSIKDLSISKSDGTG